MKSPLFSLLILFFSHSLVNAQVFAPLTAGGDKTDLAAALCRDAEGNAVLAGWTQSFGDTLGDALISSFDAQGRPNWTRSFGGSLDDGISSIQALPDGGFILAGHTASFGAGLCDFYLLRLDAAGDTVWTRSIGTEMDEASSGIALAADGNYLVTGFIEEPILGFRMAALFKVSPAGEVLWHQEYNLATWCGTAGLCLNEAGEIFLFGTAADVFLGEEDLFVVKTDAAGNPLWQSRISLPGMQHVYAMAMKDGECYLTGFHAQSMTAGRDLFLAHLGTEGALIQFTSLAAEGDQVGRAIALNEEGACLVTGWDGGSGTVQIPFLKFGSSSCELQRAVSIGGAGNDFAYALLPVGNDFILAGKTDQSADGTLDAMLLRVDADGSPLEWQPAEERHSFTVFPNPCVNELYIQLPTGAGALRTATFTDAVGHRFVLEPLISGGQARVNLPSMPSGIYLLHCIFERGEATRAVWVSP